jgi:hypothetical protein
MKNTKQKGFPMKPTNDRMDLEKRVRKERRRVLDRRMIWDPAYQGAKRRKILDRRCGIDRRQIF